MPQLLTHVRPKPQLFAANAPDPSRHAVRSSSGMALRIEWKDAAPRSTGGGVRVEEAASVLGDPCSRTIPDPSISAFDGSSFVTVGLSNRARMLVLKHIDHGDVVRILSAQRAIRITDARVQRWTTKHDFSNGVRGKYASRYWDAAAAGSLTAIRPASRR